MRQLTKLLVLTALSLQHPLASAAATYPPADSSCKAYPGSKDWPSKSIWDGLNKAVGGRLLHPDPPAAACHSNWPEHDAVACDKINASWSGYEFHTKDPISNMWDQFSNFSCLPDAKYPCSASGYPAYVVNATTPEHISVAIRFAKKHNVRLNVKNTGHDYMGRSIAAGALSIWTHHFKSFKHHKGGFKLHGTDITVPGNAITVGAGTQMYDAYQATDKLGEVIVGGGGKTVGLGGYITGGGHSVLSPKHGLAADQVLQMELVTPSGEILTVNEKNNADLFWAMRGGGGSTFGVLTSITLKTFPTPKILYTTLLIRASVEFKGFADLIAYIISEFPYLGDAGIAGYSVVSSRLPNPVPSEGAPKEVAGFIGAFILQDGHDEKYFRKVTAPLNKTIQKRWPGQVQFNIVTKQYPSFLKYYEEHYDNNEAGLSMYIASRLLGKKTLSSPQQELSAAVKSVLDINGGLLAFIVSGKGVHDARPRGGSDSLNPGWRKSYVHMISSAPFLPFNEPSRQKAISALKTGFDPLRKLSPTTGAYLNEAFPFEEDWQHTFWGDNYERLLKIKKKVDPNSVFWCHPCVGNEGWKQRDDGRLCKVDCE